MKNRFLYGFLVGILIIGVIGCSSILHSNDGVFGKAQKADAKIDAQIRLVENQQAQLNEDKLAHIGAYSRGGVEYSLNQIPQTNVTPEVNVAKKMNERVEALAGKPDFKEVEAIKGIVDELLTFNKSTQEKGEKALAKKDKEIADMQKSTSDLNQQREKEISAAMAQADINAQKADSLTATLKQMDSWGGLGAIIYGVKRLVVRLAWGIGIFALVFLILRVLSASNPIAAGVFQIFNVIGAWVVHTITALIPKAINTAGYVEQKVVDDYKALSTKLVDTIQQIKIADPSKSAVVASTVNLTPEETAKVTEIKATLNYK